MPRFTIDFNDENDRQLEELVRELGVRSKADVIRKAIGLLAYAVDEKKVRISNDL